MKKILAIITIISISQFSCDKEKPKREAEKTIRLLSFDSYVMSANPEKKNMEIFSGNNLQGTVLSPGRRMHVFSVLPEDEATIYAIREITTVDLQQGSHDLKPGEAIFLPAGTLFRLSSKNSVKNEKSESKVLLIRSNNGPMQSAEEIPQ